METKELIIEEDLRSIKYREDGRAENQLRKIKITRDFNLYAEGSVLIAVSYTHLTLPTKDIRCRSRWSPYH